MLIKLTFFNWVKKFYTRALCTIAWNFVSYRALIHSSVCIIHGKPGSEKKAIEEEVYAHFLFKFFSKHSVEIMSFVHSLKPGVRYSSVFLLWRKDFLQRFTHLDVSVCLHTSVMRCFMKQFHSWFSWWPVQLPSNQSRNDLCKKPNATETPLKDSVCMKGSHPVFLCSYFLNLTKGSRIQEWMSSLIPCLLSSLIP